MFCDSATSDNVVLGVIGADVIFAPLFMYLHDNFDPCKNSNDEYSIRFVCFPYSLFSVIIFLNSNRGISNILTLTADVGHGFDITKSPSLC